MLAVSRHGHVCRRYAFAVPGAAAVVAALDRATLAGHPLIRIIHGYGTGRLKAVLREYLAASPYVIRFRAGERNEGGDGVTIAELR